MKAESHAIRLDAMRGAMNFQAAGCCMQRLYAGEIADLLKHRWCWVAAYALHADGFRLRTCGPQARGMMPPGRRVLRRR